MTCNFGYKLYYHNGCATNLKCDHCFAIYLFLVYFDRLF